MASMADEISRLKAERNAVILAHNYVSPEVQGIADYVGDSLGLSMKAASTDASVIVFCGVSFMGETAKVLSPNKMVLLPEPEAHCPMASMCTAEQLRMFKERNPGIPIVGYVNSTVESKVEMDVCCTSSNAIEVVNSLESNDVLFVPDMNLGRYVASRSDKNVRLWDGFCPLHQSMTRRQLDDLKAKHPDAVVLAHPECRPEVLERADFIGSTEAMMRHPGDSGSKEFILFTEEGLRCRLERDYPDRSFYFPSNAVCTTMKMVTLKSVLECLRDQSGEVLLGHDVLKGAYRPVRRMMDVQ